MFMGFLFIDLQQRRLHEAQDEYDQEQEILKEEFDTERLMSTLTFKKW